MLYEVITIKSARTDFTNIAAQHHIFDGAVLVFLNNIIADTCADAVSGHDIVYTVGCGNARTHANAVVV